MGKYLRGDKRQLAGGKILLSARAVTKDNVIDFLIARRNWLR